MALTPERGCWVTLPPSLASRLLSAKLPLPVALDLAPTGSRGVHIYVGWTGATSAVGVIGVPAALARSFNLTPDSAVALRILPHLPPAASITLEPASEDDWEVVELNAGHIEDHLLSQVGVTAARQSLPVWVRGQHTLLTVVATDPAGSPVRLVRGTEVAIAPRIRRLGGGVHTVAEVLKAPTQH